MAVLRWVSKLESPYNKSQHRILMLQMVKLGSKEVALVPACTGSLTLQLPAPLY